MLKFICYTDIPVVYLMHVLFIFHSLSTTFLLLMLPRYIHVIDFDQNHHGCMFYLVHNYEYKKYAFYFICWYTWRCLWFLYSIVKQKLWKYYAIQDNSNDSDFLTPLWKKFYFASSNFRIFWGFLSVPWFLVGTIFLRWIF